MKHLFVELHVSVFKSIVSLFLLDLRDHWTIPYGGMKAQHYPMLSVIKCIVDVFLNVCVYVCVFIYVCTTYSQVCAWK